MQLVQSTRISPSKNDRRRGNRSCWAAALLPLSPNLSADRCVDEKNRFSLQALYVFTCGGLP
jgi:hypothetical protein